MAITPSNLPTTRTNTDPQQDTHPDDHNDANTVINEVTAHLADTAATFHGDKLVTGGGPGYGAAPVPGTTNGVEIKAVGSILSAVGDPSSPSVTNLVLWRSGNAGSVSSLYARFARGAQNATLGSIDVATTASVNYNTTSDPRLKVKTGEVTDAADRVKALGSKVFRGHWVGHDGETHDLLSSHDIEDAAHYAVTGTRDAVNEHGEIEPQQVAYHRLFPLVLAALAEALERIDALESS